MLFSKSANHFAKLCILIGLFILPVLAEPILATTGRYTAQRKPRVTVMEFENTNADAVVARYGQSVEAMLVTFLKRKSQFVVVERQKLGPVLEEWENNQLGMTNLTLEESRDREILEKLDGIILGSVTLLDGLPPEKPPELSPEDAPTEGPGRTSPVRSGRRIEIDVKLLSRADGRIVAAVQRSGPVSCLRSVVERLGVALEREFLRPYFGKLMFKLSSPENVHLYLTPVLMNDAMDEEKPPVERGSTVHIGTEGDILESWTTTPTTYTIEDVLSGWYSIRLERPGYDGSGTENNRWEARSTRQGLKVYEAQTGKPLQSFPMEVRRFLIWVDPLGTELVDGDELNFEFRKKRGSIEPLVKRQYLDSDYSRTDDLRILLVANEGIDLNSERPAAEFTEDQMCDLFEESTAGRVDYGRTHVAAGQSFDFESFEGGELIIEDYRGETLPVGQYRMVAWAPYHQLHTSDVFVQDRDRNKAIRTMLIRQTVPVEMSTTGPRAGHQGSLRGHFTQQSFSVDLGFEREIRMQGLPVDRYSLRTDVPGLGGWHRELDLMPEKERPPVYDPNSSDDLPITYERRTPKTAEVRFKTGLVAAGRVRTLGALPEEPEEAVYWDTGATHILDHLLWETWDQAVRRIFLSAFGAEGVTEEKILEKLSQVRYLQNRKKAKLEPRAGEEPPAVATVRADSAELQEQLPTEVKLVRALLAGRLEDVDLLVLSGEDLDRLQALPEARALLKSYVTAGGALIAFVTSPGNYDSLLGAPLSVDEKRKRTKKFRLEPGTLKLLELPEKKQKIRTKRAVPQFDLEGSNGAWRILAYGHRPEDPRILERGRRGEGGYVLVWGDNPAALKARKARRAPEIEWVRLQVADRAFDWARFLMYRQYDDLNQAKAEVEEELFTTHSR